MATIQDYLEAAKGAIISGGCDRSIALCEHVLRFYPKHLEAHCLLAEANREQGDLARAEDICLRVLSADPERLIARWGLSILDDDRGDKEAALGQLRIALEINPDHAELRKEVVRLSGVKAKPTLGGLARLYLRGGLFDEAVNEFRTALSREPQRLDLLVGLAEALWRGGRDDEASEVCRHILDDSPDCLKPLVIVALIESGRKKQQGTATTALWHAAYSLDPEQHVARELAVDIAVEPPAGLPPLSRMTVDLPEPKDKELLPDLPAPYEPSIPPPSETQITARQGGSTDAVPSPVVAGSFPAAPPVRREIDHVSSPQRLSESQPQQAEAPFETVAASLNESSTTASVPVSRTAGAGQDSEASQEWLRTTLPDAADEAKPVADHGESARDDQWGEWGDLLNEEITLDPEAEARLSAALADIQQGQEAVAVANGRHLAAVNVADRHQPSQAAPVNQAASGPSALTYLRMLEANPDDHETRLLLAKTHCQAGQCEAALAEYRTIAQAAPQLANETVEGLQELLRAAPDYGEAHRALGDIYMKTGRFQQAIDEYNQALSLKKVAG